jgi:hypothetical protein
VLILGLLLTINEFIIGALIISEFIINDSTINELFD